MKAMKIRLIVLSAAFAIAGSVSARAAVTFGESTVMFGIDVVRAAAIRGLENQPLDLINWKVGDNMVYDMELGFFGKLGVMNKSVTKDEGTAIWVTNSADLMGQKQVVEALINKADGKILKLIQNGQEQQIPDDPIEIISQEYTEVTVPAGTFKAMHVVAKSKQVEKIEIWANPTATAMDGAVQQIISTQMGDMTMKLTSFKKN